jgi:hypothetical protein
MIEVPHTELTSGTNYYISKGQAEHKNKQFGTFMKTDIKPNGDAWVYFKDIEYLDKMDTIKKINQPTVFILRDTDIYEDDPNSQEYHFYKEVANPIQNKMYRKLLDKVLNDPNAIDEYSKYLPTTRKTRGKGGKGIKKTKRTKKQRKSKRRN